MSEGNVNGAIKLLSHNMVDGIVPLNNETLEKLREKHPVAKEAEEEVLLLDHPIEILQSSSKKSKEEPISKDLPLSEIYQGLQPCRYLRTIPKLISTRY